MPSFCCDIEDVEPGLLSEFCSHEGDESQPWRSKLDGSTPCLDRDWRKIVFRFFDYFLTSRGLLDSSYRPDGRRLEIIVHPFRFYYGQVLTYPKLARTRGADSLTNIKSTTSCDSNFSDTWPWSSSTLASVLSHDANLEAEARAALDRLNDVQGVRNLSHWVVFRTCLERADVHDLGRTVFSSMNSYPRKDILKHDELQRILSMIQNLIDCKVGNCDVLRKIMFDIVDERYVLPDCLKVTDIEWDPVSGDSRVNTRGGYADIYNGIHNGQRVALKMLRSFSGDDSESELLVLYKEAIVWRQLNHDNILPFYGICETLFPNTRSTMLISPWMELGDLSEFCRFEKEQVYKGTDFMLQIARGLDYLHSQDPQIIHGDLRGSNILLEKTETGGFCLRLTDFGITEVTKITTKVTRETTKGALRWMAPEIIDPPEDSQGSLTTKSDAYSFAMTCIEIFAGKIPFEEVRRDPGVLRQVMSGGRPEKALNDSLAEKRGLDDFARSLITRCWDSDHVQRPRMSEVVLEIERYDSREIENYGFLSSMPDPDLVTEYDDVIEVTYNKARMMAIRGENGTEPSPVTTPKMPTKSSFPLPGRSRSHTATHTLKDTERGPPLDEVVARESNSTSLGLSTSPPRVDIPPDRCVPTARPDGTSELPPPHELPAEGVSPPKSSLPRFSDLRLQLRSPSLPPGEDPPDECIPTMHADGSIMIPLPHDLSVPLTSPTGKTTQANSPLSTLEADRPAPRLRKFARAKGAQPPPSLASWLRQKNLPSKAGGESSDPSAEWS